MAFARTVRHLAPIAFAAMFVLGSCATFAQGSSHEQAIIAFVGGTVIDPARGLAQGADVIVVGDRVVAVEAHVEIPRGARRIDVTGKYLVPGLWDSHAHFNALTDIAAPPELFVSYGVLSVRDMGGDLAALQALRASIVTDERLGPNLFMAGPTLNGQQSAPFHRLVRTADEARAAVRELSADIDFIKVHRRTSRAALMAAIEEGRLQGLEVYGHVPLGVRWDEAAGAGMRSSEHIFTILENELSDPDDPASSIENAIQRIDGARGDAIFAAMAAHGTYLCPTLVAFERSIDEPPELAEAKRGALRHFLQYVNRAHHAGVPILAGSDVALEPGSSLLREFELLVEAGLSPLEALQSATAAPASLLRRPDLGHIAAGSQASFLIIDADPLQRISELRELSLVVLRGRVIDQPELNRLRTSLPPVESAG